MRKFENICKLDKPSKFMRAAERVVRRMMRMVKHLEKVYIDCQILDNMTLSDNDEVAKNFSHKYRRLRARLDLLEQRAGSIPNFDLNL